MNPLGVAGAFAGHFNEKIKLNVSRTRVDVGGVYNGKCLIIPFYSELMILSLAGI